MKICSLLRTFVLLTIISSCTGQIKNIKKEKLHVKTVKRIQINESFPDALKLAAKLEDLGYKFNFSKDWFGPETTPVWIIKIGSEIDVYTAQVVITLCREYAKGNIIVTITGSDDFRNKNRIYIGSLSDLKLDRKIQNKKIKKLLNPKLSKDEFKKFAD